MPHKAGGAAALILTVLLMWLPVQAGLDHTIVLDVRDRAGTSPQTLVEAEHDVGRILASIGTLLRWRIDSEGEGPSGSVAVLLVSEAAAIRQSVSERLSSRVLGLSAPMPARRVWIYTTRIRSAAAVYDCSEGHLLGHVIAHEVLHAIAGLPHSPRGVMRSSPRAVAGALDETFTDEEVTKIREAFAPAPPRAGEPVDELVASARRPGGR